MSEVPAVAGVQQSVGRDKFTVLVLNVDPFEGETGLRTMKQLARNPAGVAFAADAGQRVTIDYGIRALGTKIFIDPQGNILKREERYMDPTFLQEVTRNTFGFST